MCIRERERERELERERERGIKSKYKSLLNNDYANLFAS